MTKDNTNQRRKSFMTETTATKPGFEQLATAELLPRPA
jgi:hypothetical protein